MDYGGALPLPATKPDVDQATLFIVSQSNNYHTQPTANYCSHHPIVESGHYYKLRELTEL